MSDKPYDSMQSLADTTALRQRLECALDNAEGFGLM